MKFEYKGYTLYQEEDENHHIMIFDKKGDMCMHASYEGDMLTQEEAEKYIENMVKTRKRLLKIKSLWN